MEAIEILQHPPAAKLHKDEKQYILDHMDDGPGAITHALNTDPRFTIHNQGQRRRNTVEVFRYRERRKTDETVRVSVPVRVIRKARKSGISEEEIQKIARAAIMKKVGATG